ncbi:hypothetical protein [Alloscardovia omnicolens]|uniref:hypothetical protein n=1 Tax=Alloscardovia omnicolens TaxID=419015 RepID=UPI003A74F3C2
MDYHFGLEAGERKPLVKALKDILGVNSWCSRAPEFSYHLGEHITLDKKGCLHIEGFEEENNLLAKLGYLGFIPEELKDTDSVSISVPRSQLTDAGIERLRALLASKETIIKRALAIESVDIKVTDEVIVFDWFDRVPPSDELSAYTHFISLLIKGANDATRIVGKNKEHENEKYYFRCFLLRLGMIGNEYKDARRILLSKLSGSSAFKHIKEEDKHATTV